MNPLSASQLIFVLKWLAKLTRRSRICPQFPMTG